MGCLLLQHGVFSWSRARYGSHIWKAIVILNCRRVMQTLFTRLGFDEDATDKPCLKY
jgi:hypothetical protein